MKSFLVQPFGQRVYVTADGGEFLARYNREKRKHKKAMKPTELDGTNGMAVSIKTQHGIRYFALYIKDPKTLSTIFHESLHMTHFLMKHAGMPICPSSTELQAYTMEAIAEQTWKKLQ